MLISWTCYGQWLHGDTRGSVDVEHNDVGEPFLSPGREAFAQEAASLAHPPYRMDAARRRVVLGAIRGVCRHRGWTLHAVHVRALHVHVLVSGAQTPERMMNDFKAYASRALNAAGFDRPDERRWTRHGSTRYVNGEAYRAAAAHYVLEKQGEPMERWPDANHSDEPHHADEPRP